MSFSDEILDDTEKITALRGRLKRAVLELSASAAFLVDETGSPFATVGHVEFELPHPLVGGPAGDELLEALVGEMRRELPSSCLVERMGRRALVAVVFDPPLSPDAAGNKREDVRRLASELRELAALSSSEQKT